MITVPISTNTGIRFPARTSPEKPERMQADSIPPIGVSIQEAAKLLNVGKPLMADMVKIGKVRAVKIGKRVVVSVQSLRDCIDGKTAPENSPENTAELQGKKE